MDEISTPVLNHPGGVGGADALVYPLGHMLQEALEMGES